MRARQHFASLLHHIRCQYSYRVYVWSSYAGHPILNDPVYNLDIGSDGVQGLPSEWTVDRAIAQRTRTLAQVDTQPPK